MSNNGFRLHRLAVRLIIANRASYPANEDDSDHQGNRTDLLYAISHFILTSSPSVCLCVCLSLRVSPRVVSLSLSLGRFLVSLPTLSLILSFTTSTSPPPPPLFSLSVSGHRAHPGGLIEIVLEKVTEPLQQSQTGCEHASRARGQTHTHFLHAPVQTHTHRHLG